MIVYKATNKLNGMIYVGQTTYTLEERKKSHKKESRVRRGCPKFHNAINKYGFNNFSFEVIGIAENIETLNNLEEYYIEWFNSIAPNGYNLDSGGNNRRMHEESKRKIGLANKGKTPNKGKKHTDEAKIKISNSKLGKKLKPFTEEHKKKIGDAHRGIAKPHTEEWIENHRIKMTGRKHTEESKLKRSIKLSKPVICITDGKEFPSIKIAAEYHGLGTGNLVSLLKGKINYLTSKINGLKLTFRYKLKG